MRRGTPTFGEAASFTLPPLTRVVRVLLVLNLGAFALQFVAWLAQPAILATIERTFGLVPARILQWPPFLWQFATYPFLHSVGNPFHLLMNMLFLYMLGGIVEERRGSEWFARLYALSALVGGIGFVLYGKALLGSGEVSCIGASGAILGVVVAAARLYPRMPVLVWFVFLPLWAVAAIFVALDVLPTLIELRTGSGGGGVAHAAHLGGALAGFVWAGLPDRVTGARWTERLGASSLGRRFRKRRIEGAEERRRRMDALLAKIAEQGIGSLTGSERRFLHRESARAREERDRRR